MTPQILGAKAYKNGVNAPYLDSALTEWLATNTSGLVGSALIHYQRWYVGYNNAQDIDLVRLFPELCPHLIRTGERG